MSRFLSFWDSTPIGVESVKGCSMTIPDQSLSVRDILNRYQLGSIQLSMPSSGEVSDDDYIDSFDSDMDLVDAMHLVSDGNDLLSNISTPQNVPSDNKSTPQNVTSENDVTDSNV